MRRTLLLAVVAAACGGPPKPPEPIGNTGDPPTAAPQPSLVAGVLVDEVGQPLEGATVVLVGANLVGEQVVITNAQGQYSFAAIPAGTYELSIFYADRAYKRRFAVAVDGEPTTLNQAVPINGPSTGETMVCRGASADSCR